MAKENPKKNIEGYPDPTAYAALKAISRDKQVEKKAAFVITILRFIAGEAGFEVMNRIELRHKQSKRTFR